MLDDLMPTLREALFGAGGLTAAGVALYLRRFAASAFASLMDRMRSKPAPDLERLSELTRHVEELSRQVERQVELLNSRSRMFMPQQQPQREAHIREP